MQVGFAAGAGVNVPATREPQSACHAAHDDSDHRSDNTKQNRGNACRNRGQQNAAPPSRIPRLDVHLDAHRAYIAAFEAGDALGVLTILLEVLPDVLGQPPPC